jgi:hypothetical protein
MSRRVATDFPREVVAILSDYLRAGRDFEEGWEAAMKALQPREMGWTMATPKLLKSDPDEETPLDFLEAHCRRHYEARQRELRGEPGLVPVIRLSGLAA